MCRYIIHIRKDKNESYWTAQITGRSLKCWSLDRVLSDWNLCLSVCVSVCSPARGQNFWPRNLIFWHSTSWDIRKKNAIFCFLKFGFLALWGPFFGHFGVFSSLSFVILLYVLQVILMDLQTSFLAHRVFMIPSCDTFNDFKKMPFEGPIRGPFIFKNGPNGRKT